MYMKYYIVYVFHRCGYDTSSTTAAGAALSRRTNTNQDPAADGVTGRAPAGFDAAAFGADQQPLSSSMDDGLTDEVEFKVLE